MTEDPTVNLETREEIDWLRQGRHDMEGLSAAEAAREVDYATTKVLVQGNAAAPSDDVDDDARRAAAEAFDAATNIDADALNSLSADAMNGVHAEKVRNIVLDLLQTPSDDWDSVDVDNAQTVAEHVDAMLSLDDPPRDRLIYWGHDPDL